MEKEMQRQLSLVAPLFVLSLRNPAFGDEKISTLSKDINMN
jgi:hypothetical protein